MSALKALVNPRHIVGAHNHDKRAADPIYLGTVHVDTNHDDAILDNVTWFPYSPTDKYNTSGRNGYIEGTIRRGATTSRLFQYTSTRQWEVGSIKRMDYAHLDKILVHFVTDENNARVASDEFDYRHYTCG